MSHFAPPASNTPIRAYDLVVVGASAGGIQALTTLVGSLPVDFAAPLVIAQHLDPDHVSHLRDILARSTPLQVRTVLEEEPLVPGVIYVVPADRDVEITDHHVRVRRDGRRRPKPSVNRLFSSAAKAHGERLIGVILTGAGSDGTEGARDVKAAGGMVIIENPATAAYASMPQSLAPSTVDLQADLANIGLLLAQIIAGTPAPAPDEVKTELPQLIEQLRAQSGIDFSPYKPPTIVRRLQRRLVATAMPTLGAYLRYLPEHPDEYRLLLASFLIKVTDFFRDPDLFGVLRAEIVPAIVAHAQAQGEPVRCWSAGCATGEEAYSLAIVLAEVQRGLATEVPVRIFATDVDADAIAFARRGIYPATTLARMPGDLVARYFTPIDDAYTVIPALRSLVVFGLHDLGQRAPFPRIDLVLCRNVLIYFTSELQRHALQLFAFALRDGGTLALGKAETPQVLPNTFVPWHPPLKLYQRQGERLLVPPMSIAHRHTPLLPMTQQTAAVPRGAEPQPIGMQTKSARAGELLLALPVGIVIVDGHYDIQAINATAQRVLGIFRSAIGEDLLHSLTTVPVAPVRAIIDAVLHPTTTPTEGTVATLDGAARSLHFAAYGPPRDPTNRAQQRVLLWITEATAPILDEPQVASLTSHVPVSPLGSEGTTPSAHTSSQQLAWATEQLDRVSALNRTLVAANAELIQANLDLVNGNEEIVLRHEELQVATEEIKTLNEELQANNEELETMNEEMEATVEELRTTNDDLVARTSEVQQLATRREEQRRASVAKAMELVAILDSMGDALIVLDQAGEIQFTNGAYVQLFGDPALEVVAEDEEGHALPPAAQPRQQAAHSVPFRMTFTLPTGEEGRRWIEATGEPIRAGEQVTGGVISFRDITDRSLRRLQDEFLAMASHELRSPLTSIKLAALMLQRLPPAPEGSEYLRTILRQVQRLQRLIDELSEVSRLQHGTFHLDLAPLDLAEVAGFAVASLELTGTTPPIQLDAPLPVFIRGDTLRIEQILTNLLTNARKYAPDAASITVRVLAQGNQAEIQVVDTGPGIPAAVLPQLFHRYFQVAPGHPSARSGLGLGLYITRELVRAHQGSIQVDSIVGQGTTFTLRFPLLATRRASDE